MPRSMTAFARNTLEFSWGSMTCELRSVNHRFLETSFRLPETLREKEMQLREIARKKLSRGKVDCALQVAFNNADAEVSADLELARRYINIAEKISAELDNPATDFSTGYYALARRSPGFRSGPRDFTQIRTGGVFSNSGSATRRAPAGRQLARRYD